MKRKEQATKNSSKRKQMEEHRKRRKNGTRGDMKYQGGIGRNKKEQERK